MQCADTDGDPSDEEFTRPLITPKCLLFPET